MAEQDRERVAPIEEAGTRGTNSTSPTFSVDVALYLASRFLWTSATQIGNVAVGWLIYEETHSALALGLVGLAAFGPKFLISLVSGIVADHFDRRHIMAVALVIKGLASLGLLLVALAQNTPVGAIYALFVVSGIAQGFAGPAGQAMVANLVPRERLSRVMGLASSTGQVAAIAGPAFGGFLYIAGSWAPFGCAAACYLIAAATNLMIRLRERRTSTIAINPTDIFAGLVFIWQRPVVLGAISLDLFAVLLGGATALLPIVASDILNVGPAGLGVLRSMPAAGALTLGLFLAYVPIRRNVGQKLFVATVVFGLATIGLGLSTSFYLSLILLWLIGASDVFSVVIRHTLVQGDTPDHLRGRVAAVNSIFIGASNELGEFESGVTAAIFGLVPAILIGGIGTVGVTLLWAVLFPQLRRRDQLVERPTD